MQYENFQQREKKKETNTRNLCNKYMTDISSHNIDQRSQKYYREETERHHPDVLLDPSRAGLPSPSLLKISHNI